MIKVDRVRWMHSPNYPIYSQCSGIFEFLRIAFSLLVPLSLRYLIDYVERAELAAAAAGAAGAATTEGTATTGATWENQTAAGGGGGDTILDQGRMDDVAKSLTG